MEGGSCYSSFIDPIQDVWFKFKAVGNIANVSVVGATFGNSKGTLRNPQMVLYRGQCGSLKEVACGADPRGNNISELFAIDLVIGVYYYLRVDGKGTNQGTFQLCVNNYNEVPSPKSDCQNAVILCDKSSFTVPSVIGSGRIKENPINTCLREEKSSAWYKFTCDKPGSLTFVISPVNPADDIDFALFFLPDGLESCSNKVPIRCMASGLNIGESGPCGGKTGMKMGLWDTEEQAGCQPGDDNFVAGIEMLEGQSFALLIQNYSNTGNGFSVEFGGTSTFLGPKAWFKVSKLKLRMDTTLWTRDVSQFAGGIAKWEWNFGLDAKPQGSKRRGPHVVRYASTGKKSIRLTIETKNGCVVTVVRTITVIAPPKEKPKPPPEKMNVAPTKEEEKIEPPKAEKPLGTSPPKDSIPVLTGGINEDSEIEVENEEKAETRIIQQKWEIKRVGILYFQADSFNVIEEHAEVLAEMVALLKASPDAVASVEGHTNNIPHTNYCTELSQKRALSVRDYLISKGIAESRLTDKAIGKKRPKEHNRNLYGRRKNQRVEVLIMYPDD